MRSLRFQTTWWGRYQTRQSRATPSAAMATTECFIRKQCLGFSKGIVKLYLIGRQWDAMTTMEPRPKAVTMIMQKYAASQINRSHRYCGAGLYPKLPVCLSLEDVLVYRVRMKKTKTAHRVKAIPIATGIRKSHSSWKGELLRWTEISMILLPQAFVRDPPRKS